MRTTIPLGGGVIECHCDMVEVTAGLERTFIPGRETWTYNGIEISATQGRAVLAWLSNPGTPLPWYCLPARPHDGFGG